MANRDLDPATHDPGPQASPAEAAGRGRGGAPSAQLGPAGWRCDRCYWQGRIDNAQPCK